MIAVACVWAWMIFVCGAAGVCQRGRFSLTHFREASGIPVTAGENVSERTVPVDTLMTGTVAVTVYAGVWSLFGGVSFAAGAVLAVFGIAVWAYMLRRVRLTFPARWPVYVIVFFVMAYGTSHGIAHYDTGLYHAQAIRWIEEYGSVPGLGNLHLRLAYNSAAYPLSALFSMKFIAGQSYHVCAGWMALLLAWKCTERLTALFTGRGKRDVRVSDFVSLCAVYYLCMIYDEMVSPASDYFVTTLTFYLAIAWCECAEDPVRRDKPYGYAALCVLAVYAMTLKLSSAMLVLLVVMPLSLWIREGKRGAWKEIAGYLALGCVVLAPFLARNVVLSGWLVYPFPALDLFSFDWEIPAGTAAYDAKEIAVYGRGMTSVLDYDLPLSVWGPRWFNSLSFVDRAALVLDIALLIVAAVLVVRRVMALGRRSTGRLTADAEKTEDAPDYLPVVIVFYAGLAFWFTSAPLIRYGCVYVWMPAVLLAGWGVTALIRRFKREGKKTGDTITRVIVVLAAVFLVYKGVRVVADDISRFDAVNLVRQQEYEKFETVPFTLDGMTFYRPVNDDRAGYDPFPSAPAVPPAELRGEALKAGFRAK